MAKEREFLGETALDGCEMVSGYVGIEVNGRRRYLVIKCEDGRLLRIGFKSGRSFRRFVDNLNELVGIMR